MYCSFHHHPPPPLRSPAPRRPRRPRRPPQQRTNIATSAITDLLRPRRPPWQLAQLPRHLRSHLPPRPPSPTPSSRQWQAMGTTSFVFFTIILLSTGLFFAADAYPPVRYVLIIQSSTSSPSKGCNFRSSR